MNETAAVEIPEVEYARSGDVAIAYQVVGDGPVDLVYRPVFRQHPLRVGATALRPLSRARRIVLAPDPLSAVRRELARFRGEELDTAGDGFFATFDGPARAIRCAQAIVAGAGELGLELRAALHTGESELHDGKPAGIAVSVGARVAGEALPGEVLVSSTVKDLVAGSGIAFEDRHARAQGHPRGMATVRRARAYELFTAVISFSTESFASPNSIVVFGSR